MNMHFPNYHDKCKYGSQDYIGYYIRIAGLDFTYLVTYNNNVMLHEIIFVQQKQDAV